MSTLNKTFNFDAIASAIPSNSVKPDRDTRDIHIFGTFVATVEIEVSNDLVNWFSVASTSIPTSWTLINGSEYVRLNVTAFTSGVVSGNLSN